MEGLTSHSPGVWWGGSRRERHTALMPLSREHAVHALDLLHAKFIRARVRAASVAQAEEMARKEAKRMACEEALTNLGLRITELHAIFQSSH